MHSRQELIAAAKSAACKLVELRRIETEFGPVWYGKAQCPSSEATFTYLRKLAESDEGDPELRLKALKIRRIYGPEPANVARAIQAWVKQRIGYLKEPQETFQSAAVTMHTELGDCDDHATLVHVMGRAVGLQSRIAPLRKTDKATGDVYVRHAVAQFFIDGAWRWVETTLDARFGEHPVQALRRLRLGGRADLS